MEKKKVMFALFQHFDSRGGSFAIRVAEDTMEGFFNICRFYLEEVAGFTEDEINSSVGLHTLAQDFTGIIWIRMDDEVPFGQEVLWSFGGDYHIVAEGYGNGNHNTAIFELVKSLSVLDEVKDEDDYKFEPPQHIKNPVIADAFFYEDACGLYLF